MPDDSIKEIIKKEISKNEIICDLSNVDLNQDNLEYILKELKASPNIGEIKWKNKKEIENQDLIIKIENELILNNKKYRSFSTDYIHCLLCSHCNQTEFDLNYKESNDLFDNDPKYNILKEQEWKVQEVFKDKGYKSVLYINKRTKHLILAFEGIKLKISDFFLADSSIESVIYSMVSNIDIAPQTIFTYLHTQLAVELCKKKKIENYSLSFTGYGFGAWLAEQAIYFSMKEFSFEGFEFDNVKAVTFDSPGSLDYLEILNESNISDTRNKFKLVDLNIVTYLSAPNFTNTCNGHLGKVYRIFTQTNQLIKTNEMVYSLIEQIPNEIFKTKLRQCYDDKIQKSANKLTFFVNGFILLYLNDGLNLILNEFELNTGKPTKYKQMIDWPKIVFTPSTDFKVNFNNLFDLEHIIDSIPDGGLVPKKLKQLLTKLGNLVAKKAVSLIADNLLNGLQVITNFMLEILKGSLNSDQFEYDDSSNEFDLKHFGHYRIKDANLNDDILLHDKRNIDECLYNLFTLVKNKNDLNELKDEFIQKQLFELKNIYELYSKMNRTHIKSKNEIETIRFNLDRLFKIKQDLKSFLLYKLIGSNRKNTSSNLESMLIDVPVINLSAILNGFKIDSKDLQDLFEKIRTINPNNNIHLESVLGDAPDLYFTGRDKELKLIENSFKINQYVYIHGRSGYGKTQLALQYAVKIINNSNQIIRWIKNERLINSFQSLAQELNIDISQYSKLTDLIEIIKNKINQYCKEKSFMFFIDGLIYDADNELKNDYQYLIYGFNENIKFLITTKDQTILSKLGKGHKSDLVTLNGFDTKDCTKYINKKLNIHHKKEISDDNWKEIFQMMSSKTDKNKKILPIHLNKLISKLNGNNGLGTSITFNELKIFLENELKNSFYLLKQENKIAFEILCYFGFLNEEGISRNLIYKLMIDQNLNQKQKELKENKLDDSLNYLIDNSEILANKDGDFSIHETTQMEILKTFEKNEKKEHKYLNKILEVLNNLMSNEKLDETNVKMSNRLEALFNHAIKLVNFEWKESNENSHYSSILIKISIIYQNILNKNEKAIKYYNRAILLQSNNSDKAKFYNSIGEIYRNNGEYDKALDSFNKAKQSLPPNHPDIANSYNNIGSIYYDKGEYDRALDYYYKSMNIKKSISLDDAYIHSSYNLIGNIYVNKGEYDKALEYFDKSLTIRKLTLPPNHPDIANSYNNIGSIYNCEGKYDEALDYYNKALNIQIESLPPNHPDIADSYNNIGQIFYNKGEYDKALDFSNESLKIQIESLPPNHPDIANSYNNIGRIYNCKGEYVKALEYFDKSLKIQIESLPPNHPDIANSYNNIGSIYNCQGEYDKALDYYNKALNIQIESLPPNHPDIADSYNNIELLKRKILESKLKINL